MPRAAAYNTDVVNPFWFWKPGHAVAAPLILGTRNQGKVVELRGLLAPLPLAIRSLADFPERSRSKKPAIRLPPMPRSRPLSSQGI